MNSKLFMFIKSKKFLVYLNTNKFNLYMATYIPQIQGYLPEVQPFKPDYNLYGNVLGTLQQRYDKGHEQLSKLYGKLLTSPLSREDSIEKRNEFFKQAEKQISQIAGLDLSQQQNVRAAQKIFDPLYNDDHVMKDMAWTSNYQKELSKAGALKNCLNPDDCNGLRYWEQGQQHLGYQMEDFKNVSEDEMLNFRNPEFVPDVDVFDQAIKLADKMKVNVEVDQDTGKWIVTYKNGELVTPSYLAAFKRSLGSNQMIKNKYRTTAVVSRRNYMQQFDNPEEGKADYLNYIGSIFNEVTPGKIQESEEKIQVAQEEKEQIQKRHEEGNLLDEVFAKVSGKLDEEILNNEHQSKELKTLSESVSRFGLTEDNVDQMYADLLMEDDLNTAALILSNRDKKISYKQENPDYKRSQDFGYWKVQQETLQANKKEMEKIKAEWKMVVKEHEKSLEKDDSLIGPKEFSWTSGLTQTSQTMTLDPKQLGNVFQENFAISENNYNDYTSKLEGKFDEISNNILSHEEDNSDFSAYNMINNALIKSDNMHTSEDAKEFLKIIKNENGDYSPEQRQEAISTSLKWLTSGFDQATGTVVYSDNIKEKLNEKLNLIGYPEDTFVTKDVLKDFDSIYLNYKSSKKEYDSFLKERQNVADDIVNSLANANKGFFESLNLSFDKAKPASKFIQRYSTVNSYKDLKNIYNSSEESVKSLFSLDDLETVYEKLFIPEMEKITTLTGAFSPRQGQGQGNFVARTTKFNQNRRDRKNETLVKENNSLILDYLNTASTENMDVIIKYQTTDKDGEVIQREKRLVGDSSFANVISSAISDSRSDSENPLIYWSNEFSTIAENDVDKSSLTMGGFNPEFNKRFASLNLEEDLMEKIVTGDQPTFQLQFVRNKEKSEPSVLRKKTIEKPIEREIRRPGFNRAYSHKDYGGFKLVTDNSGVTKVEIDNKFIAYDLVDGQLVTQKITPTSSSEVKSNLFSRININPSGIIDQSADVEVIISNLEAAKRQLIERNNQFRLQYQNATK